MLININPLFLLNGIHSYEMWYDGTININSKKNSADSKLMLGIYVERVSYEKANLLRNNDLTKKNSFHRTNLMR